MAPTSFPAGTIHRQHQVLDEAFDLLGERIALAHAKDLSRDGEAGQEAAGTGLLDYDYYLGLLHSSSYRGALILHSLSPEQVPSCVRFLQAEAPGTCVRSGPKCAMKPSMRVSWRTGISTVRGPTSRPRTASTPKSSASPSIHKVEGRHLFLRCGHRMVLLFNAEATAVSAGGPKDSPVHGAHGAGHLAFAVPAR